MVILLYIIVCKCMYMYVSQCWLLTHCHVTCRSVAGAAGVICSTDDFFMTDGK